MIVYGDTERSECSGRVRDEVVGDLRLLRGLPAGDGRHDALVETLIRAGELAQGLADEECARRGFDAASPVQACSARVLLHIASALDRSARGLPPDDAALEAAARLAASLPSAVAIRTRLCEGFAHYALMPESYLEAARASQLPGDTLVIGLRSIGTSLGALVAAALGSGPPITLRPTGPPFARIIRADPALIAGAAGAARPVAVVDEGPGLSGSSFAAAARWLLDNGIERRRITFFCGHGGEPGAAASAQTRALWSAVARHNAASHDVVRRADGLGRWLRPDIGELREPPRDFDGFAPLSGRPRDLRFERLKFIVRSESGTYVAKFAGLGGLGRRKHADAVALAEAGFGAETIGLRRGFIVQRWLPGEPPSPGLPGFVERLGDYLAFRARSFPEAEVGAQPAALREMAVHNAGAALGREAAASAAARLAGLALLQGTMSPVRVDSRLHAWEWLAHGGRIVKTDAVDHCAGHDLVGCQDIAWDIAGASVELGLGAAERASLLRAVARAARPADPALVRAFRICYSAFQLGLWSTASPADRKGALAGRRRASLYAATLLADC